MKSNIASCVFQTAGYSFQEGKLVCVCSLGGMNDMAADFSSGKSQFKQDSELTNHCHCNQYKFTKRVAGEGVSQLV